MSVVMVRCPNTARELSRAKHRASAALETNKEATKNARDKASEATRMLDKASEATREVLDKASEATLRNVVKVLTRRFFQHNLCAWLFGAPMPARKL